MSTGKYSYYVMATNIYRIIKYFGSRVSFFLSEKGCLLDAFDGVHFNLTDSFLLATTPVLINVCTELIKLL